MTQRNFLGNNYSSAPKPKIKSTQSSSRLKVHAIRQLNTVEDIPAKYKGILLDQFGVLHNGKTAYPKAIDAVHKLAKTGKKIVILSNSSRRATLTLPKLGKLGFEPEWFAGAVTSGDITFQCLESRSGDWWQNLGRSCLHISWGARGQVPLSGLNLQTVLKPEHADFVLSHGTEVLGQGDDLPGVEASLDELKALLEKAAKKGIPLIVANPDVVTVSGDSLVPMPGTFARWYSEWGGEVKLMGKPDPIIYESAMKMIGLSEDEVVAVGDSLEHDIAGATSAGIDSIFVAGGIHADELGVSQSSMQIDNEAFQKLVDSHEATPSFTIPYLN